MTDELYYVVEPEFDPLTGHATLAIRVGTTSSHPENGGNERYLDESELEDIASDLEERLNADATANAAEANELERNIE